MPRPASPRVSNGLRPTFTQQYLSISTLILQFASLGIYAMMDMQPNYCALKSLEIFPL